jgi:hypothetical protein
MTTLAQVIAVTDRRKNTAAREQTTYYRLLGTDRLLTGLARTYTPANDEGERRPPEGTKVQVVAGQVVTELAQALTPMWDCIYAREEGNTRARADIIVGGEVVAYSVPVTYLLFLEHQLTDLVTFMGKLPVLPAEDDWEWDPARACYATRPAETRSTAKVPRNHVLAAATDKHPAQVQVYHEDKTVGTWSTTKLSGAMPATRVRQLTERATALLLAVRTAREHANTTVVEDAHVAAGFFTWLLA